MAMPRGERYQVNPHGHAFAEDAAEEALNKHASAEAIKNRIIRGKPKSPTAEEHEEASKEFAKQLAHEQHAKKTYRLSSHATTSRAHLENLKKAYSVYSDRQIHGNHELSHHLATAEKAEKELAVHAAKPVPEKSNHPAVKAVLKAVQHSHIPVTDALKHLTKAHAAHAETARKSDPAKKATHHMLRGKKGGMYYLGKGGSKIYAGASD